MLCQEVIDRLKEKIPQLKVLTKMDYTLLGMLHMDIIREDKSIKQLILLSERLQVMEPEENIKNIFADVYVRVKDKTLYQLAVKEISLKDALKEIKVYGDGEVWQYNLEALKEVLPHENFQKIKETNEEEEVEEEEEEEKLESPPPINIEEIPEGLRFLVEAFNKLKNK